MLHSFSRKGNPYDNACIESFHSVLKKEEIYLHTYQDASEARRAIFEYIEGWYNRKRIHSTIGYLTPQQKEEEELKKQHKFSTFFVQSIDISPVYGKGVSREAKRAANRAVYVQGRALH